MTDHGGNSGDAGDDSDVLTETVGVRLLRRRGRLIVSFGVVGLIAGIAVALLVPGEYISRAMLIPQSQETGSTGLEIAASQFGVRLPSTGAAFGSAVYVELLRSRMLLEPIALESVVVPEEGRRRVSVMDLLGVRPLPLAERTEATVRALRRKILATEDKKLNAVRLEVTTQWPTVSLSIAEQLVRGVNRFNLETRKTQASEERKFVEGRATDVERSLRDAEDRLQSFMQRNRSIAGSPQLTFAQDRLQRDVALWQSVFTSLLQKREEARIREVRDVPVVTVIESPKLPVSGESRRLVMHAVLWTFVAAVLGLMAAVLLEALAEARMVSGRSWPGAFEIFRAMLPSRIGAIR